MSPIIVPEYLSPSLNFDSTAQLNAQVAVAGSWSALTSFTISGLFVEQVIQVSKLYRVIKYVGEHNVPGDIRRLRRSVHDVMRRMGQPVIVKHMFTDNDVALGIAQASPALDSAYGQTREWDPYSYGTGFCSVQRSTNEWINPNSGAIVSADIRPGPTFNPAPMYRGYGPGYLTYIIEPDVAVDAFKLNATGALTKVQDQTVVAAWFPEINDNDLIINVELDRTGNVADTTERYQAKTTRPISIRGLDRRGEREYARDHGNRFVVNQAFEMSKVPDGLNSPLYRVEIDR